MNSLNIHLVKEITVSSKTFGDVSWKDIKIKTETDLFEIALFAANNESENLALKVLEDKQV